MTQGTPRQGRASPDKQASVRHLGFAAGHGEHIAVPALPSLHHTLLHLHRHTRTEQCRQCRQQRCSAP